MFENLKVFNASKKDITNKENITAKDLKNGSLSFSSIKEEFNCDIKCEQEDYFIEYENDRYRLIYHLEHKEEIYDYHHCIFLCKANFRSSTFTKEANFIFSTFTKEANFRSSTFTKEANFIFSTFTKEANFISSKFTEQANFNFSTFTKEANFISSKFTKEANFISSTFTKEANFISSKFTKEAYFNFSTFKEQAYFNYSTFKEKMILVEAEINNLDFKYIDISDASVHYEGLEIKDAENRETFLVFKQIALKQNDKIQALEFYTREMDTYYHDLEWGKDFADKFLLMFEKITSNFGTNIVFALLWYLLLLLPLLIYCIFYFYSIDLLFNNYLKCFSYITHSINPIARLDDIFTKEEYEKIPFSFKIIYDILSILKAILIYEIIKSFRKYSRVL